MKVKVWIGGKEEENNIERLVKRVVIICMMCSFASYTGMI